MHGQDRHPVQLFESIALFLLFLLMFELFKRGKSIIIKYLFAYGLIRFSLEFLRGDKIRGEDVISIFSTSQVIALFIVLMVTINHFKSRNA